MAGRVSHEEVYDSHVDLVHFVRHIITICFQVTAHSFGIGGFYCIVEQSVAVGFFFREKLDDLSLVDFKCRKFCRSVRVVVLYRLVKSEIVFKIVTCGIHIRAIYRGMCYAGDGRTFWCSLCRQHVW